MEGVDLTWKELRIEKFDRANYVEETTSLNDSRVSSPARGISKAYEISRSLCELLSVLASIINSKKIL